MAFKRSAIRTPPKAFKKMRRGSRAIVPSSRARTLTIPRGVSNFTTGFPKQISMVHKYVSEPISFTTTGVTGTPSVYTWRANGMYDPDVPGLGHQPMYYDTCLSLYNHYTVIASKVTFRITIDSNTVSGSVAGSAYAVCYIEDDTTVSISSFSQAAEQPSASAVRTVNKGGANAIVTKYWNARQAFGGDTMDNTSLRGSGANPVEEQSFVLVMASPVTLTAFINVATEIEYTAVWTELKPQAQN